VFFFIQQFVGSSTDKIIEDDAIGDE
jgi:hypothetical protein